MKIINDVVKTDIFKIIFISIILISFTSYVRADNNILTASIDSLDYLYLRNKYPFTNSAFLKQYESEVLAFEKNDSINGIRKNQILFNGSSTIKLWSYRINSDMYPLPVIDRGFGGSSLMQNIYYFDRVVKPYSPLIEVFYCANDYGANPNTVLEYFRYYEYLFHDNFPKSTLYYVSTNPSINIYRKAYINNIDSTNKLIKNYIKTRTNTFFIDTFHSLMPNGVFDLSYFGPDSLHLNDKGYSLITTIIKPIIKEKYNTYLLSNPPSLDNEKKLFIFDKISKELELLGIASVTNLIIYDTFGRMILNQKVMPYSKINLSKLNKGVYIIDIITLDHKKYREKILV